ncbi:MAG TPA: amidohydrolase [Luteitalea sp.]|nr:amidohydrolase [Luteitalea sp.]
MTRRIPLLATLTVAVCTAWPAVAQNATAPVTAIRNATILTVTKGTIEKGTIVIRNGRIATVGANIDVPRGATEIDATGLYVMPGIIDAHSHIAVDGSVNELSLSVTAMVGIEDVLNPDDIDIYRGLAGGVTTANVLHGSGNAIGGKNAVIKLRWGKEARALLFEGALPGIKFALGENPKRASASPNAGAERRYPTTRMGVIDVIREAFVEARAYQGRWRGYDAAVKAGDRTAVAPARDLALEPLVEILEGKRLVHAHSYRADEILQLLRLAEEFKFKVATLQHVLEGYKVADEIAKHGAGGSTFSDWWGYKFEVVDAIPYNAALMTDRGVLVSINSDSAEEHRHLNQEAAKTMKYGGLSEEQALKLITLNPATQLGIDKRVGSIEVGKDADLVLYTAHPLSVYAIPQQVLIDGVVYFDRAKDLQARDTRAKAKQALKDKEKAGAAPARSTPTETTPKVETTPRVEGDR